MPSSQWEIYMKKYNARIITFKRRVIFKLDNKLTKRFINVKGAVRMNARLAVNLFSDTVFKVLSYYSQHQFIDKCN